MTSSSSSSLPVDLHKSLLKILKENVERFELCESDGNDYSEIDYQIALTCFSLVENFPDWYRDQFEPSVRRYEKTMAKSLEKAFSYQKMAETFIEMIARDKNFNPKLSEKAFYYINKAIKYAPLDEANFICECFSSRSQLHVYESNRESALSDVEKALHFRAHSFTSIKRKINFLIKLNRQQEAYRFVDAILNSKMAEKKFSAQKLDRLKVSKQNLQEFASVENEVCEKSINQSYFLRVTPRVKIYQDKYNKRYGLKASGQIPEGTVLFQEEPSVFVLKSDGLKHNCAHCWKKCTNTFWPCANCIEVIYCSDMCANADAKVHSDDCAIVELLNQPEGSRGSQVYRHLMQIGHQELIDIDRDVKTFSLDECLEDMRSKKRVSTLDSVKWFSYAKSELIHRLYIQKPKRTAKELGAAIFLLSLYLHKRNIAPKELATTQLFDLIRIMATDLAVIFFNEYGWNEYKDQEKQSIGAFQCLFSSQVGHSCQSNAKWSFDGCRFELRSTKAIEPDHKITISFGVTSEESFFARQAKVQNFSIMCACDNCIADSAGHFCLQCDKCGGPVPWDKQQLPNEQCIQCECKFEQAKQAPIIQQGLKSIQSAIWLMNILDNANRDYFQTVQTQMKTLALYIHPRNVQFQELIRDLTSQYISHGMFDLAVGWYQWMAVHNGIYFSGGSSPLESFNFANQWAHAFTSFLKDASYLPVRDKSEHIKSTQHLINQMSSAIKQWETSLKDKSTDASNEINEDFLGAVKAMNDDFNDKFKRLVSICRVTIDHLINKVDTGDGTQDVAQSNLEIFVTATTRD